MNAIWSDLQRASRTTSVEGATEHFLLVREIAPLISSFSSIQVAIFAYDRVA